MGPCTGTHRRRRWWWRLAVVAAGALVSGLVLHGRFPAWPSIWAALRRAELVWLALGVLLQVASMAAASGQQRQLLTALRVPMPVTTSLAVTYVRAAMSIGLPVGSALSTGYAFRQFRARGAGTQVAVTVLTLCGVASAATLALLYAVFLVAWVMPAHHRWLALVVGVVVAVAVGLAFRRVRRRRVTFIGAALQRPGATRLDRLWAAVRDALRLTTTITARQWCLVGAFAMLNWVADAATLLAGVRAVGLATPALDVLATYLAVQLIRQVPTTSAGVTETSLLVALTAAGAVEAPAAAAVFIYRLLSCWAVLPVGLACWAAQQAGGAGETDPATPERQAGGAGEPDPATA